MAATTLVVIAYPEAPMQDSGGQGVRAVFSYQDFAKIHLGDVDVVVLAAQAERVCTIDATVRASIK